MGTLYIVSIYAIGFISGIFFIVLGTALYGQHLLSKRTKDLRQKVKGYEAARERLDKVRELTQQQFEMQSYTEQPQKNALDGKFKNGLTSEIKRLEEEKKEILQSILKDGVDPEISVLDDAGEVKNMKLSELMAQMGIETDLSSAPIDDMISPTSDVKRVGRFLVHEGGKISQTVTTTDDGSSGGGGSSNGGNNTTH